MLIFRAATAGDARTLSQLAERTFRDAFSAENRPSDLDIHCSRSYSPEAQERELRDPRMATVVAEQEGALVAYAQLQLGAGPDGAADASAVELRRFYVLQALHGSGLAQRLMQMVMDEATERGGHQLWLGVWERNPRAIRFYEKCGFSAIGERTFVLGDDPQRDLLMALPLSSRRSITRGSLG
jgi:diamine N-acetyltransferase